MKLNPQQSAAVHYADGPLMVLAGAGSGKTRVIIEKIAWLISEQQLAPEKIAAITFTNKAAKEMRQRTRRRLKGRNLEGLVISTFHALGWKILQQHAEVLGYRKGISILDEGESMAIVRDLLPANAPKDQLKLLRGQISSLKNRGLSTTAAESTVSSAGEAGVLSVYQRYQEQLKTLNAVDFDDLIMLPVTLLAEESIRMVWQEKLRYLLVDEYQDTNTSQYQLLKYLAGPRGAFTVVGDDDQSIYGWRGAQPENLRLLGDDYPSLHTIKLEQNYRSSGQLLKAANAVIANNDSSIGKRLWSRLPEGEPIRVLACGTELEEAQRAVSEILHRKFTAQVDYGDFAILYRGNHQSRVFEQALREQRIPYHLSGGTSFFERTEIKDLMAYFRLLINPDDNSAFLRVVNTPRRELGSTSVATIGRFAAQHRCSLFEASLKTDCLDALPARGSSQLRRFCNWLIELSDRGERGDPLAVIEELIEDLNYSTWIRNQCDKPEDAKRRIENVAELTSWITRLHNGGDGKAKLSDLIGQLALMTNIDADDDPGKVVRLMTMHAAKGLEFKHVFIVGVEEGTLPHRNSLDEGMEEEERRLMYVGITRAMQSLCLSFCDTRKRYGEQVSCKPSRFLDELPEECVSWEVQDDNKNPQRTESRAQAHLDSIRQMFDG